MPVASAAQKEPQVSAHLRHLLPKPSGPHQHHSPVSPNSPHYASQDGQGYLTSELGQYAAAVSSNSPTSDNTSSQYFNPHSPPILNLSPNLSPTETQRNSPIYDLRETTTRRRNLQDLHNTVSTTMAQSTSFYSGILEDTEGKTESPTRKRRKLSQSVIDLTHSPSPPPVTRQWDLPADAPQGSRQFPWRRGTTQQQQRRPSGDRTSLSRGRRSPNTRRRAHIRDRHMIRRSESPERRAFQPPSLPAQQLHPAVLPHQMGHPHHPLGVNIQQVTASNPVTVPPYGISVCTGTHHIPVCTGAHMPVCTTQPTWSLPGCNIPIPSCNVQHLPACSIPVSHAIPPLLQTHPPAAPHHPSQHHHHLQHHQQHHHHQQHQHLSPPTQFLPMPQRVQTREELQLLSQHVPLSHIPASVQPHHHPHPHQGATLNPSPPVLLQEPTVHPNPHDLYISGPFARFRRNSGSRSTRWRGAIPPPPPPYPGFLLHFLAMLGNSPLPPYSMDLNDDGAEAENYEALLNLAERLGEAKPRGLIKSDIKQLPSYQFNAEVKRSGMDQTSCVVCMCDFESRQLLRVLPCSHEFHAKCVDKWLKANRTCPICRTDASEGIGQSE